MSKGIGAKAEQQACQFLQTHGLSLIMPNYHCRWGEIDLIMRDDEFLILVEVRARRSLNYGGALASITASKKQKLIKTAQHFQCTHPASNNLPARFDVVILQNQQIEWLKNAFDAE